MLHSTQCIITMAAQHRKMCYQALNTFRLEIIIVSKIVACEQITSTWFIIHEIKAQDFGLITLTCIYGVPSERQVEEWFDDEIDSLDVLVRLQNIVIKFWYQIGLERVISIIQCSAGTNELVGTFIIVIRTDLKTIIL